MIVLRTFIRGSISSPSLPTGQLAVPGLRFPPLALRHRAPLACLILLLTVLCSSALGTEARPSGEGTAKGIEPCVFRVQVMDVDGRPVAGARVAAVSLTTGLDHRPAPTEAGETDEDGRVEIRLPADLYRWAVASDRHPSPPERIVDLRQGCDETVPKPVELAPGVAFYGRVSGPDGEPVVGADARILWLPGFPSYLARQQQGVYQPHRQAVSDAEGSFSLSGLEPGVEVEVFVHHPGFHPARRTVTPSGPDDAEEAAGSASPQPTVFRLDAAARLEVEVVDPDDRPLEGATVDTRALGEGEAAGGIETLRETDAHGRHEEGGLKPGEVQIRVVAPGYEPARRVVELAAGETRSERFVLDPVPSAAVEISVVDEEGDPVEGAPVHLGSLADPTSGSATTPPAQKNPTHLFASSNAEGNVSWPRIPLGSYRLSVRGPSDDVGERLEPERLEVPEQGLEHQVVLRRPPGRPVEGRVLDPGGDGLAAVTVQVFAGARVETRTDGEGRFRFDHLPYGEHQVRLDVPGAVGTPTRTARVGETLEGWIFRVERGVEVFGRLHLPPGFEPQGRWEILATRADPRFGAERALGWIDGSLDGEPSFRFPPLAPGRWTLEARNDRAEGRAEVELERGPPAAAVHQDITVRHPPEGFPVTGTLLHRARALVGARVSLRQIQPRTPGRFASFRTRTDARGRYALEDVPAAGYHLSVAWGGFPVLHRTVEVSGPTDLSRELRFARVRGRVEVEGVDPSTLTVRLSPRGPDDPAAGWFHATHSYPEWARPNHDGAFEVGPLEEGRWVFQLDAPGHAPCRREVVIDGADVEDLVLAPEPTEGLVLRVMTARGQIPDSLSLRFRPLAADDPTGGGEAAPGEQRSSRPRPGDLSMYFDPAGPTVVWDSVPPGRGLLWLETRYAKAGPIPVQVPGPEVRVELPPRGKVRIRATRWTAEQREGAAVTIRPVDTPRREIRARPFGPRDRTLRTLVPGLYEVEVTTEDGRVWAEVVEVRDHETTEVVPD